MDRVMLVVAPEETVPTFRLMEHAGAGTGVLLYDQVQVTSVGRSTTTEVGFAENEASTGATGWTTVTRASFVDSPAELEQRKVKVVSAVSVTLDCNPPVTGPTPSIAHAGAGLGVLSKL